MIALGRRSFAGLAAVICAVLLGSATQAGASVLADWRMNEPSSARTMWDSGPLKLHGTIGALVQTGVSQDGAVGYLFPAGTSVHNTSERLVTVKGAALNPEWSGYAVTLRMLAHDVDGNLVQKGQATTPGGFFKVEIHEAGKVMCLFRGANGTTRQVTWPTPVVDGRWHTIRCERRAGSVAMSVDWAPRRVNTGDVGRISNTQPLAVGGKASCSLRPYVGCDHFSGLMDYVRVERL